MSGTGSGPKSYSFRISAEGMQEFVQELQRLAGGSEAAQAAINRLIQSSPQLANSMLTVQDSMAKAAEKAADLAEQQRKAAEAGQTSAERLSRASDAFGTMESKANAARRSLGDFRGALELIGAGNIASALSPVGNVIGNLADAMSTAGNAARAGATGLGAWVPVLGGITATITAGVLVWQNWGSIVDGVNTSLRAANDQLGILPQTARLADTALSSSKGVLDDYAAAVRRARGEIAEFEAQQRLQDQRTRTLTERNNVLRERGQFERAVDEARGPLTRAEQRLAAFEANPPLLGATVERQELTRQLDQQRQAFAQRETELRGEIARRDARIAELDNLYVELNIQGPGLYGGRQSLPPAAPAAGGGGGGGVSDEISFERGEAMQRRAIEQGLAANQRALERATAAEARELEQRRRENERTTNDITRYIGDRFADTFANGTRGFQGMLESFRQMAIATPVRIAVDAVMRPIVASGVEAFAGAGGLSGITSALGLSGIGSQISGALGLSGAGAGLGGLLGTRILDSTLWQPGAAAMFGSDAAALGGAMNSGAAMAGGLTIGQAIGGVGAGFGVGSLVGSFVAQSAAQRTNSMIGAGIGSIAGTLIGGPLGGIIGGAVGGAGGGLLGPSSSFSGGDAEIGVDPATGRLVLQGMVGKNFDSTALAAQASQQIAATNSALAAAGLRFDPSRAVGGYWARDVARIGGGESGNPRDLSTALGASGALGLLTSSNASVMRAISGAGSLDQALGAATWVTQVYEQLSKIANPADAFAQQLEQINSRFADAIAQAERYGLATDGLRESQAKAVADLQAQQAMQERAKGASARGLLEELTFGSASALTPEARGFAALTSLNTAKAGIGGAGGLDEFARVAGRTLPVIRDIFGTTERYGGLLADTAATLRANAPGGDIAGLAAILEASAAGTDRTTEAIVVGFGDANDLLAGIRTEIANLSARIEALARRAA